MVMSNHLVNETCNLLTQESRQSCPETATRQFSMWQSWSRSCDLLCHVTRYLEMQSFEKLLVLRLSQSCQLLFWTNHCCLVLQYHLSLDNTQLPDSLSQFQFSIISPKILTFRTFAMVAGVVCHFTQSVVETRVWWTWNISWLTVYSSVLTITSTSTTYSEQSKSTVCSFK